MKIKYWQKKMVDCWIPYGKTEVQVRVPEENLLGVIGGRDAQPTENPQEEVNRALDSPLGTGRVEEIAKPGMRVCIVVDDKTRSTPSYLMVRPLLERLSRVGVKENDITVLFGCGAHIGMRIEDSYPIIGEDCARRVNLVIHDAKSKDLVLVGATSFGTKIRVNRVFAEADLKILTGDICLHYFAGYGGGRKSVLPAITDAESITHNHALLTDPRARTGNIEGNPVHLDMVEAAHLVGVDFAVNLVLNSRGGVVKAFAGDVDAVFQSGVKLVDEMYKVPVKAAVDIVVVSPGGYPADIDLYQAYKGIDSALNIVKDDGVVVLIAECIEGYGSKAFFEWMTKFKTPEEMRKELRRNFVIGAHKAYYLARALDKARIILVSTMPDCYAAGVFRMKTAKTANNALNTAFRIVGKKAKVAVLPRGTSTLPILKEEGSIDERIHN
jgi:nickel-dependent lactate racemase